MPIERNPNDPYQSGSTQEELRRRATRVDEEFQADPNLSEGPATGGRIALFAIAIIAILGAIFYGMNTSTTDNSPTQTTTTKPSSPSTTGSAPAPSQPSNTPAPSQPSNTPAPAPSAPAAPSK
jgi:hypothetical protein